MVKKVSATLGFAFLLAFGLTMAGPAEVLASGCTWTPDVNSSGYVWFQSEYTGTWDQLWTNITTWGDGVKTAFNNCGNKQYEAVMWTQNGTPIDSFDSEIRVWVCGNYKGQWKSTSGVVWSPVYSYGICPRQADNNSAHVWTPWYQNGNVYLWAQYVQA